ncbi:WD repeat-containing protein 64 isoform X1 [Manacus candei]|uniref:WD repeat-containing protein 64 isoform X1 n=1 Tax=Manacus candei TaxID=415023 RepID=UPI002227067D|nr:WD repeat-containing protein 64 isoform X1 [Manacus candei]XP_051639760.1 WD repeat-containing protein 64 isoform X1 [Manacus candei]
MSEKKARVKEGCSALKSLDFKNALEQFQKLVEKMIIQKTKERSGLYTEDDDEIDYDKFYKTTRALFGSAVKDHNIQAFFRKTINNLDMPDWLEIFGCFTEESDGLSQSKESMVFLVSEKKQITDSVVKRKDVIKGIVKVSHLDFTITASQKGVITIFNNQRKVQATINIEDAGWITGCDFLPQLKYVVAVTESTVIIWDYKSEEKNNGYVIKPMKNCLLCVCTVTASDHLPKDTILMGDDKGYVYLLTMTSDDFIMKQYKAEKESQFRILDSENFNILKRKLHDDWVGRVKYISALKCFGSCSSDSLRSFVLDDIKRLEDNLPVREFSVPRGVNAFTYCGKAKVIVTGGNDRVLRLWNPAVNIRPTGKLFGHKHSVVEIVTNEKDQHVISLSSAKVFRVWDIQTLAPLQVFHDNQVSPEELDTFPMVFDNDHGILITGSDVIDIYPLANVIEDTRQLPQTHEKSINALIYNRTLHQLLTICTESILKVWDLETGYQIYQIEDAHGVNTEVTCAAIEINGFYVATGACDGTVKIWEFESGQEFKALPLAQHSEDEHRVLKIVYLKADESQHALLVLEQRGEMKIIQGNSTQTHLHVAWVLPDAVSFPRRNPVVYLLLKPDTSQDFFPAIRLLSNISSLGDDTENFAPSVEINCFAVLKVEGWNLIATGSANGEIILWDFESASVRCLHETNEDSKDSVSQESGINAMLFLVHGAFTYRKRSSQTSTSVRGDVSAIPEHESSSLNPHKENVEIDKVNTEITTAEDTAASENIQYPKMNVQSSKSRVGHSPILASAHESGCIRLWSGQGDLMKELLPFSKDPSGPLTVLCTDISTKMLLAGSKEGYVICWNIASFLEDSQNKKKQVKEKLCWRAHNTEVVDLFHEEEKNVVVTASIDGSVRIWHADSGYYFGYFGQSRKFELSDTNRLILPPDVKNFTAIIKEESKPMEKKVEYPLMLDKEKWKSLSRLPFVLEKAQHSNVIQDFKFFQALAPEKMEPQEIVEPGSKEAGAVYGILPIYELEIPAEVSMPKSLQRIKAMKSSGWTMDKDSNED